MPVGRIESAWLYPMSFGEILRARGNPSLAEAIAPEPLVTSLPEAGHGQALRELRDYLFCGGMP
jgi:predicted AAA+ superfamily ATPase